MSPAGTRGVKNKRLQRWVDGGQTTAAGAADDGINNIGGQRAGEQSRDGFDHALVADHDAHVRRVDRAEAQAFDAERREHAATGGAEKALYGGGCGSPRGATERIVSKRGVGEPLHIARDQLKISKIDVAIAVYIEIATLNETYDICWIDAGGTDAEAARWQCSTVEAERIAVDENHIILIDGVVAINVETATSTCE